MTAALQHLCQQRLANNKKEQGMEHANPPLRYVYVSIPAIRIRVVDGRITIANYRQPDTVYFLFLGDWIAINILRPAASRRP
jgi:hypothetical protein